MTEKRVHRFYDSIQEYEKEINDEEIRQGKTVRFVAFTQPSTECTDAPMKAYLLGEIYGWNQKEFDQFIENVQQRKTFQFKPNAQGNGFGSIKFVEIPIEGLKVSYGSRNGIRVKNDEDREIFVTTGFYLLVDFMEGVWDEFQSIIMITDVEELVERLLETREKVVFEFEKLEQKSHMKANDYCEKIRQEYVKRKEIEKQRREKETAEFLERSKRERDEAKAKKTLASVPLKKEEDDVRVVNAPAIDYVKVKLRV